MPVSTWPAGLPQRMERQGYQESMADGRLRTQMDAGPAKIRMRSRAVRMVSGTFLMTAAQYVTFETFVQNDLNGGASAFTFPQQGRTGTWLVRLADTMPSFTIVGITRRVSVKLEILP